MGRKRARQAAEQDDQEDEPLVRNKRPQLKKLRVGEAVLPDSPNPNPNPDPNLNLAGHIAARGFPPS